MQVKISEEMEGNEEYGRIRIPKKIMDALGYAVGGFIQVRGKLGDQIHLVVDVADGDDDMAQITKRDFSRAFIKNKQFAIRPVENIMLGCDPEVFLVETNGKVAPAYRYFHKNGQVGNDGVVMELRPPPDISEEVVVGNLYTLLRRARMSLNATTNGQNIRIIAVSAIGKLTAGFHLHYGLPDRLLGFGDEVKRIAELLTYVMDYYVGIPSIIPEGEADSGRRMLPYVPYGKPGQFRLDKRTFEYRMPGAANMKHPALARGLIALGAVVVEDFVSRAKKYTGGFSDLTKLFGANVPNVFYGNLPPYQQIYDASYCADTKLAKRHLDNFIINDVRKMMGYNKRRESVEQYFLLINQNIQSDVDQNWNFTR